ncbi:hypothetical protein BRARA_G00757 [Brassica rapa]|uniref:Uncharacterized protein n=2 Tax=Brassica TaxID=3705 RepID=A0A397YRA4_BRACM|nr:hypothetical protein BRARA_G00757 [Brassica rapa]CAF2159911.1 unnamed protein product [Brassica napus]CAG7901600.1 unnamed protein product [Brassica rapa]
MDSLLSSSSYRFVGNGGHIIQERFCRELIQGYSPG